MNDFCGKKLMIVLSGVVSIIGLIFSAVSMGTNHWIVSTGCNSTIALSFAILMTRTVGDVMYLSFLCVIYKKWTTRAELVIKQE